MKFNPTHKIKIHPDTETKHNFSDGTEVIINPRFIAGGGKMVMSTCKNGMAQFVEYRELELLIKKT